MMPRADGLNRMAWNAVSFLPQKNTAARIAAVKNSDVGVSIPESKPVA